MNSTEPDVRNTPRPDEVHNTNLTNVSEPTSAGRSDDSSNPFVDTPITVPQNHRNVNHAFTPPYVGPQDIFQPTTNLHL